MNQESYETLQFTRHGRVLVIAMNRPETLNAVNQLMHAELSRVFVDAANDAESDVIVLTGSGRAFSAGGDIAYMQTSVDDPWLFANTVVREAKQIVYTLLDCEKPVIAKVNGHATGLGATIALLCDVIFAADTAKIGDPHVRVGLVAGDGGAIIWPQLVGYARAKEYLLTGDLMSAQEAERIGLINHVLPADQLDTRVSEFAERLARGATKAIRWSKVAANVSLKQQAHAFMDTSIAYEALSSRTDDHREAVNAFREGRKAVFSGR